MLWLGARRHGSSAASALAYPVGGLMVLALFLTYSRSALLAALVVVGLWLVFVPLRLRSMAVLLAAAAAAAPILLWATSKAAFTDDGVALAVREDVATEFGLMLLALVLVLYVAGYTFTSARERLVIPPETRHAIGQLIVAGLLVLAVAGVGAVALSDRGLGGTISDRWDELTDDSASAEGGPGRLTSAASSRSRYWRQAIDVFEDDPVAGAGAGGFADGRPSLPGGDDRAPRARLPRADARRPRGRRPPPVARARRSPG